SPWVESRHLNADGALGTVNGSGSVAGAEGQSAPYRFPEDHRELPGVAASSCCAIFAQEETEVVVAVADAAIERVGLELKSMAKGEGRHRSDDVALGLGGSPVSIEIVGE